MTPRFELTAEADVDLEEIARAIASDSLRAAHRFYDAAWDTFELLARNPGLGRARVIQNPELEGLRCMGVRGFREHLIFYQPTGFGVRVVRVMHGARDIDAELG